MNILYVMPYSPVPPTFGGALREYYLLKSLTREHTVTVLSYGTKEQSILFKEDFGDLVKSVHMIKPPWERRFKRLAQVYSLGHSKSYSYLNNHSNRMQAKIYQILEEEDFDAVHCEFSVMGGFDFPGDLIRITDNHNVEYKNFSRMGDTTKSPFRKWFYKYEGRKVYKEEINTLRRQDAILSTSETDRITFQKDLPDTPNYVIPNGVDTTYFRPSPWYKVEPYTMVFTGMMGYVPNNDGMMYFLDEIFPIIRERVPKVKIFIVGNRPTEELKKRASDRVIVTDFVDDVRPFVWRSNVFVVPLRMGSGTRLKVVEALAMKKPVVSTTLGCEGIAVKDEESVLVEDEPKAFADAVIRLMKEADLREKLINNGYELVRENYDWTVVGDKILEVYESLEQEERKKILA